MGGGSSRLSSCTRDQHFTLTAMNASAIDIRSALSLETSISAGLSQPKRANLSNVKKPEGISRELYSLIGPSVPTLATQLTKPRLKQKPNLGIGTRIRWYDIIYIIIIVFTSIAQGKGARSETKDERMAWSSNIGLKLIQIPMQVQYSEYSPYNLLTYRIDYSFAQYNVQTADYTYSQDEYVRLLEGLPGISLVLELIRSLPDIEWTKEETDYLFKLVRDFDLRWYIIHDRYDYPGGSLRTLEVWCISFPEPR